MTNNDFTSRGHWPIKTFLKKIVYRYASWIISYITCYRITYLEKINLKNRQRVSIQFFLSNYFYLGFIFRKLCFFFFIANNSSLMVQTECPRQEINTRYIILNVGIHRSKNEYIEIMKNIRSLTKNILNTGANVHSAYTGSR